MARTPHAPSRLSTYVRVHSTRMAQFKSTRFVGEDSIVFEFLNGVLSIQGEIACLGEIVIAVRKSWPAWQPRIVFPGRKIGDSAPPNLGMLKVSTNSPRTCGTGRSKPRTMPRFAVVVDPANDPVVETRKYAYNASVRGQHNFLRHDNAHVHPRHTDEFHRHDMDWQTGEELPGSPSWIGRNGWPTLGGFIEETEKWYWDHIDSLPNPNGYPPIGVGHL